MFVPEGRAVRRIVFCGAQRNATAELADEIVENAPDGDLDLISALRLAVEEKPLRADSYGGVERAKIVNLANQLRRSSYVAVLFGEEWMRGDASHVALASLFRLVRELNAHTRCVVRGLGGGGNLAGAQNVLAWQTGFAAAVSFSQGYPRYLPNEFTAHTLLTRGEVDSVLIVGNDVACLSAENLTRLAGLPTIVLGPTAGALPFSPTVFIPTAIDGVHRAGIAYRLDDVPVPLKQVLESSLSSEAEVLAEIEKIILEEKCV
jgi:formylmethanofuran dehydrogenase subunit B